MLKLVIWIYAQTEVSEPCSNWGIGGMLKTEILDLCSNGGIKATLKLECRIYAQTEVFELCSNRSFGSMLEPSYWSRAQRIYDQTGVLGLCQFELLKLYSIQCSKKNICSDSPTHFIFFGIPY